ncbi:hypothetical protein ASG43_17060 [Aureimonas sp. Leaf454]|uniref:DUF1236 domain-containing protein n=1 Tax=Aureimonas sp. Leaf454 TaxID=1736381 RepID=UPI000714912D|nr:DUF1236 domain-containing protein [Aureimonas sp. Leaf454]KQT41992.1 hypothetical protein ASG43_17060 [Aureimonas sp. Leaf454]
MRNVILAAAAVALLSGPAAAQGVIVDAGGPNGGPLVAVETPTTVREYVIGNPRPAVVLEGRLVEGAIVPETVELVPVPSDPDYVYFYDADNRPVIVRASDRSVVAVETTTAALPSGDLPDELIGYVRDNRADDLVLEGRIENGYVVPVEARLTPIAGYDGYSYFYSEGRPYVVSNVDRRVVYIAR